MTGAEEVELKQADLDAAYAQFDELRVLPRREIAQSAARMLALEE